MFRQNFKSCRLASYITMFFISVATLLLIFATDNFINDRSSYNMEEQKLTIQKFAIQCYSSEGSYPPNLEYLEENYGLVLNRQKYTYIYDVFASNVMPDIIVTPNLSLKPELLLETNK